MALARADGILARFCAVGNVVPLELVKGCPRSEVASRYVDDMATESDWRLKRIGSGLQRLISQLDCAVSSGESFKQDALSSNGRSEDRRFLDPDGSRLR